MGGNIVFSSLYKSVPQIDSCEKTPLEIIAGRLHKANLDMNINVFRIIFFLFFIDNAEVHITNHIILFFKK